MPEAAALIGKRRVHGRVVEVHSGTLWLAFCQFVQRIDQGQGHARATTLGDVVNASVGCCFQDIQAFLWRALVVKLNHFKFRLIGASFGIQLNDHFTQLFE